MTAPASPPHPRRDREVGEASVPAQPPPARAGVDGTTVAADGWRTVRQTDVGFAMDLPAAWRCQTARVKLYRFFGIPFEPAPRWSEAPAAGWNCLTVDTGLETVALQVKLNPEQFPAHLAEVVNDRWAKILNLRMIDASPSIQIGELSGFSVIQNLEGVGPKVSLGPVTVSGGALKARLLQKQMWLRGRGLAVHLHYVTPSDDPGLRETLDRIVHTVRVEA